MKIEAVDLYYCAMPEVLDIGDGSQDLLLVRVAAGGEVGWGECEASPLTSIASFVCPMSHGACKPVRDSVLGQRLDGVADIGRIAALVRENSLDLLQAAHTFSGIEIALWDLLGKQFGEPVWRLLGVEAAQPKLPYASALFGETAEETRAKAARVRAQGYAAAKFGWGPYGRGSVGEDAAQVHAAREGLGPEGTLLVDAGTVWGEDVAAARLRLPALRECGVVWLEEPFVTGAHGAYRALAAERGGVARAGGEGSHNPEMAEQMIDQAGLGFVQIDAGRIGGIGPAKRVADYARRRGVRYVNHTFTSSLALSASLQPYAGDPESRLCECPVEPKALAAELTTATIVPGGDGLIRVPEGPGLGLEPDLAVVRRYLVEVEITVGGRVRYRTPAVGG